MQVRHGRKVTPSLNKVLEGDSKLALTGICTKLAMNWHVLVHIRCNIVKRSRLIKNWATYKRTYAKQRDHLYSVRPTHLRNINGCCFPCISSINYSLWTVPTEPHRLIHTHWTKPHEQHPVNHTLWTIASEPHPLNYTFWKLLSIKRRHNKERYNFNRQSQTPSFKMQIQTPLNRSIWK